MQIYTKIFIGMAAGLLVGVFVGPNSIVAPRDSVHVEDGAALPLFSAPDTSSSRVRLPRGIPA